MNTEKIKEIQRVLGGLEVDGIWGPKSKAALEAVLAQDEPDPDHNPWRSGKASSFADPADVAAFRRCKAQGKSDQECFKVGDNGIGKWGDDTTGTTPMCALPPEDWQVFDNPRGKRVEVQANGVTVICELRDTMPKRANIKNGAIIDLSPAAVAEIGKRPPLMIDAKWRWA